MYLVAVNAPEDGTYLSNAFWSVVILRRLYEHVHMLPGECVGLRKGTSNVKEAAVL